MKKLFVSLLVICSSISFASSGDFCRLDETALIDTGILVQSSPGKRLTDADKRQIHQQFLKIQKKRDFQGMTGRYVLGEVSTMTYYRYVASLGNILQASTIGLLSGGVFGPDSLEKRTSRSYLEAKIFFEPDHSARSLLTCKKLVECMQETNDSATYYLLKDKYEFFGCVR